MKSNSSDRRDKKTRESGNVDITRRAEAEGLGGDEGSQTIAPAGRQKAEAVPVVLVRILRLVRCSDELPKGKGCL